MALSLYVDTARWRAHQKSVLDQFPGLVPVCKGNGYGFGHERLADEAIRFGSDMLAVGTTYEAARIKDWFSGDLLVLTPFRRGEEPVPLPDRVIRSVSSVDGVHALVGARVVIECMSSMKRHGVKEEEARAAARRHRGRTARRLCPAPAAGPHGRLGRGRGGHRLDGPAARGPAAVAHHVRQPSARRGAGGSSSSSRRPVSAPVSVPGCGSATTRRRSTGVPSWTSPAWPRATASATASRRPPRTAGWSSSPAARRTAWAWRPRRPCTA